MLQTCHILPIIALFSISSAYATRDNEVVSVEFPVRQTTIDSTYRENAAELLKIKALACDSSLIVTGAVVSGSASLEDSYQLNSNLASERLNALTTYIKSNINIADDDIQRTDGYIDWENLKAWVKASDYALKNEVINIIELKPTLVRYNNSDSRTVDSRIANLKVFDNGRAWHYISSNYFTKLRKATAIISTKPKADYPNLEVDLAEEINLTYVPEAIKDTVSVTSTEKSHKGLHLTLKNNLLYDALLIPNIGIEYYLGKKWSIDAYWMYSWWKCDHNHNYWRTYGGDIALRRWFGDFERTNRQTPVGLHVGIYAQMLTYDFEIGGRGYLGDRWSYAGGIEAGYSLAIARRFNIDFNIGIGYLGGQYKEYLPIDGCYVWQMTKQRHWIGPTKIEASLVWLIGPFNHNIKRK
jgi:hypothetical protein